MPKPESYVPPASPAVSDTSINTKSRKTKTCKKTPSELVAIFKNIKDPTMNQIKDMCPDMLDVAYYPDDKRLKRQNKWLNKPPGFPDDVPLLSPGNYMPSEDGQEKRKPRKADLMPMWEHLKEKIMSEHGEGKVQVTKVEEEELVMVMQQESTAVQEENEEESNGQGQMLGTVVTSISGVSPSLMVHQEYPDHENVPAAMESMQFFGVSLSDQLNFSKEDHDQLLDDVIDMWDERDNDWRMLDPRMCISGMEYGDQPPPPYSDPVIPTTVTEFNQSDGEDEAFNQPGKNYSDPGITLQMDFDVERLRVMKAVADADFAGIIIDGSTDAAIQEQEMVYVCICKGGRPAVFFLGCIGTPKADATGVVKSMEEALKGGLDISLTDFGKKLVAIGSDGAAVMTGSNNGVVVRIRESVSPTVVGIHCFAHRLELAIHDVIKKQHYYSSFEKILQDLWLFYKQSALNRSNLKEACEASGLKFLVPTRVGGTRWLPHTLRALNNLWQIYPALVHHLSQVKENGQSTDAKSKAKGLHGKLTARITVEFGHFLWDLVISLSKLSLVLQTRSCAVSDIVDHFDGQIAVLQSYIEQCGPKLKKVQGKDALQGVKLTDGTGRRLADIPITDVKGNVCRDLIDRISNRFDMKESIVAATSLANLKTWPEKGNLESIKEFGVNHITVLVDHFRPNLEHAGIDVDNIHIEWTQLRAVLYKRQADTLHTMSWTSINGWYGSLAPNFLRLIDLILTLPASSTEAERGFSTMKLLKSKLRSRMTGATLNNLLRIVLLSPSESEFDPLPAIQHWYGARARRLKVSRKQGSASLSDEIMDPDEAGSGSNSDSDEDLDIDLERELSQS